METFTHLKWRFFKQIARTRAKIYYKNNDRDEKINLDRVEW